MSDPVGSGVVAATVEGDDLAPRSVGAVARGLVAVAVGRGAADLLALAATALLARSLAPDQFGHVTLLVVFATALQLFADAGLTPVVARWHSLNGPCLRGVVCIALVLGAAWAVVFAGFAPALVARFRLPPIGPYLSGLALGFAATGMSSALRGWLSRHGRFNALAVSAVVPALVSLAFTAQGLLVGWGVWAAVAGLVARQVAMVVVLALMVGPLAGRGIDWSGARSVVRNGAVVVIGQFGGLLLGNLDYVIIGAVLGASSLAVYNIAFLLLTLPGAKAAPVLLDVLVSTLAISSTTDVGSQVLAMKSMIGRILLPVLAVSLMSLPACVSFLGPAWEALVPAGWSLAVGGAARAALAGSDVVLHALGAHGRLTIVTLAKVPLMAVAVLVGTSWGLVGVGLAVSVYSIVAYGLTEHMTSRIAGVSPWQLMLASGSGLAWGVLVVVVGATVALATNRTGFCFMLVPAASAACAVAVAVEPVRRIWRTGRSSTPAPMPVPISEVAR